jgi:uncharacterized membrane protein
LLAASSQSIDNGQFKAQLAELRQQLIQAVATEERVRSLERMHFPSQEMVLGHINANGSLREEMSALRAEIDRTMAERDEARQSVQQLQLAVTSSASSASTANGMWNCLRRHGVGVTLHGSGNCQEVPGSTCKRCIRVRKWENWGQLHAACTWRCRAGMRGLH